MVKILEIINLNLAVTPADKVTDKTHELGTKSHLLREGNNSFFRTA